MRVPSVLCMRQAARCSRKTQSSSSQAAAAIRGNSAYAESSETCPQEVTLLCNHALLTYSDLELFHDPWRGMAHVP